MSPRPVREHTPVEHQFLDVLREVVEWHFEDNDRAGLDNVAFADGLERKDASTLRGTCIPDLNAWGQQHHRLSLLCALSDGVHFRLWLAANARMQPLHPKTGVSYW